MTALNQFNLLELPDGRHRVGQHGLLAGAAPVIHTPLPHAAAAVLPGHRARAASGSANAPGGVVGSADRFHGATEGGGFIGKGNPTSGAAVAVGAATGVVARRAGIARAAVRLNGARAAEGAGCDPDAPPGAPRGG